MHTIKNKRLPSGIDRDWKTQIGARNNSKWLFCSCKPLTDSWNGELRGDWDRVGVLGNPELSLINWDNLASDVTTMSNLSLANDVFQSNSHWQFPVFIFLHLLATLDSVDHPVLLKMLRSVGFHDTTLPNPLLVPLLPICLCHGILTLFHLHLVFLEVCLVPS